MNGQIPPVEMGHIFNQDELISRAVEMGEENGFKRAVEMFERAMRKAGCPAATRNRIHHYMKETK